MKTNQPSSNREWVEQEFGGVSLGDQRRERVLLDAATAIADQPDASHPQRLDWNELRSFYRLVDTRRAQPQLLQEPHQQRTRQRMEACPTRVLIVHDTTMLEFTTHTTLQSDLGPIGNGDATGWLQHNSLAFDPEGKQVLGLITQQTLVRQPAPDDETRTARDRRANKESRLWLAGIRGVGRAPAGCRWIDVLDRGGDYLDAMQESRQQVHEFVIRVCQDRRLTRTVTDETTGEEHDEAARLHETMRTLTAATTRVVSVASRGGRPAREVVTQVGYRAVRLQPSRWSQCAQSQAVTLIRVWEAGVDEARDAAVAARVAATEATDRVSELESQLAALPKRGRVTERAAATAALADAQAVATAATTRAKERATQVTQYLDWWLATSCPIHDNADALQAVSDYEWRWPVAEEYHKVEKTGLRLEGQRFETGPRMLAAIAVLAVVAVRILQLRYARDAQPEAAASQIATAAEIAMVAEATTYRGTGMTVKRFVDGVARLGGYLGRASDGPPGWQSLWRGYQRLADLLLGAELARATASPQAEGGLPKLPSSG